MPFEFGKRKHPLQASVLRSDPNLSNFAAVNMLLIYFQNIFFALKILRREFYRIRMYLGMDRYDGLIS
jgi:hypothetical protein